jgi:hypothetical protein
MSSSINSYVTVPLAAIAGVEGEPRGNVLLAPPLEPLDD